MNLLWIGTVYFMAGMARDFLATKFYQSVSGGRRLSASMLSGGLTMLDMTILVLIITSNHPLLALAYSLGCGVGVFFSFPIGKGKK
jgi:hypothetical protein